MSPNLIELFILKEFQNISNNIPFTLAEMDYNDNITGKFRFPFFPYRYNQDSFQTDFEEFKIEISNWLEQDRLEALSAITNKIKMKNPYQDWQDIPLVYFNIHSTGFSTIEPKGFFFYTSAMIYQIFKNLTENLNSTGLAWWYFRIQDESIKNNLEILFEPFNTYQLLLVGEFLELYGKYDKSFEEEITKINRKIENIILEKFNELPNQNPQGNP